MLPTSIKLSIRTPENEAFSGQVTKISFRSEEGDLEVFPGHADIAASILFSPLRVVGENGTEEDFIAKRGVANVSADGKEMQIMVLDCTPTKELREVTPGEYLKFVEQQLENKSDLSNFTLSFYEEEHKMLLQQKAHLEKRA